MSLGYFSLAQKHNIYFARLKIVLWLSADIKLSNLLSVGPVTVFEKMNQ